MAHFAEINDTNTVIRVLVTDNNDPNGDEGYQWLIDNFGGTWVQTSYNGNIRKNYAGIGFIYDPIANHFFAPQPFPSWTLDEDANWQPPTPYPNDGSIYQWVEDDLNWQLIESGV